MRLERVIHNDGFEMNKYFYRINHLLVYERKTEGVRFYGNNKQYFKNGVRFGYEEWFNNKRFII